MTRQRIGLIWVTGFIATIFAANWAIATFGVVPVGFGLVAPAGVYFAGLAFTCRDMTHEYLGRWYALAAVLIGAFLSYWVSPAFAIASGAAFLFSELLDWAVYSWLRPRHWIGAVSVSNVFGFVADSIIFLWLAFGSLAFLPGQLVGKAWVTLIAVGLLIAWRRYRQKPLGMVPA